MESHAAAPGAAAAASGGGIRLAADWIAEAEAAEAEEKGKSTASKMVAWPGVRGSRYAKDLFRAFPMPDGRHALPHHEQTTVHPLTRFHPLPIPYTP